MMTTEGTVKLIDFGIAARSGARESYLAGKPAYMAPEMVVEKRADHRSDIFSLGTVLYEMLTGDRLFPGDKSSEVLDRVVSGPIPPSRETNESVPEAVEEILARALKREPSERYPDAAAMGEACEHFLYDKGYGPTNLTLKHYLGSLFGRGKEDGPGASRHEPTLIPVGDEMGTVPVGPDETVAARPLTRVASPVETPRPDVHKRRRKGDG
jgi:serine/threonine protein kinase